MPRRFLTPCLSAPFPLLLDEPVLLLDREPLRTRLTFKTKKEDPTMSNPCYESKEKFVIYCIQHDECFPDLDEIDLATAAHYLSLIDPKEPAPKMTAEEFRDCWNVFVHDPLVMEE